MIKPFVYKPPYAAKNNSRIIPALFPALLLIILMTQWKTVSANISDTQQTLGIKSTDRVVYDAIVRPIQRQPYDAQHAFELGRFFLAVHQHTDGRAMFLRAKTLGMHEEILRPFLQFLDERETSLPLVQEKLDAAKQNVFRHPQWRDGWYLVAQYAFVIQDFDVSRQALDRVLVLDPNFQPAQALLEAVKKLEEH